MPLALQVLGGTGSASLTNEDVTISSGIAAATGDANLLTLDTEGAAASDILDQITGYSEGDIVTVRIADNSRIVIVPSSATILLRGGFTLNNVYDRLVLECIGSDIMVGRSRESYA